MKASESAREVVAAWMKGPVPFVGHISAGSLALEELALAAMAQGRIAGIADAAAVATSIGEQYGEDEAGWFECSETIANCITALIPGEPA